MAALGRTPVLLKAPAVSALALRPIATSVVGCQAVELKVGRDFRSYAVHRAGDGSLESPLQGA
jgi:hypothetical protein